MVVLVTFTSRYTALADESALVPVLGARVGEFFKQCFTIKVDSDKLPQTAVDPIVEGLQELFARHNALEALSVTDGIKPVADFHQKRHLLLTPEQNLAVEQACPMIASVKTKGRR